MLNEDAKWKIAMCVYNLQYNLLSFRIYNLIKKKIFFNQKMQ